MKTYKILVISDFNEKEFTSTSRNAKKHLQDNGGHTCKVFTAEGKQLSECRHSAEFGYYYSEF